MGVERLAVEAAREVGIARVPVVSVPDDQEVELLGRAVAEADAPAPAALALGVLDRGLEADAVAEREGVGVIVEVGANPLVVRVVRVLVTHRHVAERDAVAIGVDVKRAVRRGAAVGIAEVPVPADVVARLEARVGDAPVGESLAGREAADPGADHAGGGLGGHGSDSV